MARCGTPRSAALSDPPSCLSFRPLCSLLHRRGWQGGAAGNRCVRQPGARSAAFEDRSPTCASAALLVVVAGYEITVELIGTPLPLFQQPTDYWAVARRPGPYPRCYRRALHLQGPIALGVTS